MQLTAELVAEALTVVLDRARHGSLIENALDEVGSDEAGEQYVTAVLSIERDRASLPPGCVLCFSDGSCFVITVATYRPGR